MKYVDSRDIYIRGTWALASASSGFAVMPEALTIVSRSSKDGIGATTESTISSSSIIREPISSQVPLSPQNIPHCHHKISQITLQITLITHTHTRLMALFPGLPG